MTKKILFLLLIISQVVCGQPASHYNSKPFSFVDSLFSKENYTAEFLDFEFPQDIQDILLRVQKAMAEKKEWAQEYLSKNYKAGEGLPYHENFGVTEEEYQKIKNLDKTPPTLVVKRTSSITINRTTDYLLFKTTDEDAKAIQLLKIDLKNELVVFIRDTIPFSAEITASSLKAYGNVQGYTWKKEISDLDDNDPLKIDNIVSTIAEINFGRVLSDNKNLLSLKYKKINKGKIIANLEIIWYLY